MRWLGVLTFYCLVSLAPVGAASRMDSGPTFATAFQLSDNLIKLRGYSIGFAQAYDDGAEYAAKLWLAGAAETPTIPSITGSQKPAQNVLLEDILQRQAVALESWIKDADDEEIGPEGRKSLVSGMKEALPEGMSAGTTDSNRLLLEQAYGNGDETIPAFVSKAITLRSERLQTAIIQHARELGLTPDIAIQTTDFLRPRD